MSADLFEQLQSTLQSKGPEEAVATLCARLREMGDYNSLFYALLLKKRHELGAIPIPAGPAQDLPEALHAPYEQAIREAAREVGELFLKAGNPPQAWAYFRMLDDPEPVRKALEAYTLPEDEDTEPIIRLAFYEGVHPTKGFDWILERYGICSAITTLGGELPHSIEVKQYCIRALVRALYGELRARLTAEIEGKFGIPPTGADAPPDTLGVVRKLITDRDWLFDEDTYHIDTSHLASIVQMCMMLEPCPELGLARELCQYGAKLTGRFVGEEDAPFDKGYADYEVYLGILAGEDVEKGVAHFRAKLEGGDPEEMSTYPAEVLVNLLLKLNRGPEALAVARKYLPNPEGRPLTCPSVGELCQRFKDWGTLAEVAREQGDPVHYLAGLLAARKP